MPSAYYLRALDKARADHAETKRYSGKFLRPHAPFIKEIIARHRCRTVLDYGCGKGRQYEWVSHGGTASIPEGMTIEEFWGVPVTKYDPAYPPFAGRPIGRFDLVICTHVLGSIPMLDLSHVIASIYGLAKKAVYIAEKITNVSKETPDPNIFPVGWTRDRWEYELQLERTAEVTFSTRELTPEGAITTRGVI